MYTLRANGNPRRPARYAHGIPVRRKGVERKKYPPGSRVIFIANQYVN